MTLESQLDHYSAGSTSPQFEELIFLHSVQHYIIPKIFGVDLVRRKKDVVMISCPYCFPDPNGPKYEHYCKERLMPHKPFRQLEQLLGASDTFFAAYCFFLQVSNPSPSLANDIYHLENLERENCGKFNN